MIPVLDRVRARDAGLLCQPLKRHGEAVMIKFDRNGVIHERDQVHDYDAELLL